MSLDLLKMAFTQYGVKEISGENHNPQVLKYFQEIGHEWVKDDEMAWCSAFLNWCAKQAELEYSAKLNARSWLNVGQEVDSPEIGDIVVFWRSSPRSWKGHVGIFINQVGNELYVLGGNQNNQVNISTYPITRVLGYRKLKPKK